ncbi:MAG: hypothetical protein KKB90_06165 [Actinobacteria bacterium]|nr:hypothetical protein [Actinomycetota bacterium]MBU4218532.1 hypothetical protein [Actinomycetota bacterium]MBU4403120.1 hypothetical protein [Actinomycetota bacterium]MCG2819721.1 hypothetical protein [Actinomycetes bacterium]
MAKCEKCNEDIPAEMDICPKYGTMPGTTETISAVVGKRPHRGHKERKERRAEKRAERKAEKKRKCEKCGEEIEGFMEDCPSCGAAWGAAETITDFLTPLEESRSARDDE